jgi:hypothetical protein
MPALSCVRRGTDLGLVVSGQAVGIQAGNDFIEGSEQHVLIFRIRRLQIHTPHLIYSTLDLTKTAPHPPARLQLIVSTVAHHL